jgi:hypothetical protein
LINAQIKKGDKEMMKFDEKGVLDSVEFKIWNLNQNYEWKTVISIFFTYKGGFKIIKLK